MLSVLSAEGEVIFPRCQMGNYVVLIHISLLFLGLHVIVECICLAQNIGVGVGRARADHRPKGSLGGYEPAAIGMNIDLILIFVLCLSHNVIVLVIQDVILLLLVVTHFEVVWVIQLPPRHLRLWWRWLWHVHVVVRHRILRKRRWRTCVLCTLRSFCWNAPPIFVRLLHQQIILARLKEARTILLQIRDVSAISGHLGRRLVRQLLARPVRARHQRWPRVWLNQIRGSLRLNCDFAFGITLPDVLRLDDLLIILWLFHRKTAQFDLVRLLNLIITDIFGFWLLIYAFFAVCLSDFVFKIIILSIEFVLNSCNFYLELADVVFDSLVLDGSAGVRDVCALTNGFLARWHVQFAIL